MAWDTEAIAAMYHPCGAGPSATGREEATRDTNKLRGRMVERDKGQEAYHIQFLVLNTFPLVL
jgi:hypothetical protein